MNEQDDDKRISLDPRQVPEVLHPLIPLAEQWSIGDDYELGTALKEASVEELRHLVNSVHQYIEPLSEWLHKDYIETYMSGVHWTEEVGAFNELLNAASEAQVDLKVLFGEEHEL
jgi:hypothetical protein